MEVATGRFLSCSLEEKCKHKAKIKFVRETLREAELLSLGNSKCKSMKSKYEKSFK